MIASLKERREKITNLRALLCGAREDLDEIKQHAQSEIHGLLKSVEAKQVKELNNSGARQMRKDVS